MTYGHAAEIACIILGCGNEGAEHPLPDPPPLPPTIRLCGQHSHLADGDHPDNAEWGDW